MNDMSRPRTIVAMPAYNEGSCIGSIVLQAKQYADMVVTYRLYLGTIFYRLKKSDNRFGSSMQFQPNKL